MANIKTLVYQLWPISWGSIRMMTAFLPRIAALGADYVWLSPVYKSPWYNHGYDVSDYYVIESRLGTTKDMDEFVSSAHSLGLKVIMDLVIDSTSVDHPWYHTDPSKYQDVSLRRVDESDYYPYFDRTEQVALQWFNNGVLNRALVREFKQIMEYWLYQRDIDGFRLSSAQTLNGDLNQEEIKISDFLIGSRAITAINELSDLYGGKSPFLILDTIDPEFGKVVKFYSENTDVEFITNKMLKSTLVKKRNGPSKKAIEEFSERIKHQAKDPKFMLDLESHDAPRFTSRSGLDGKKVLDLMFIPEVNAICLYQGQELGLKNPKTKDLTLADMFELDSRTMAYLEKKASVESLWQNSRANARVSLPLDTYTRQEQDKNSVLNYTKSLVKRWKRN